MPAAKGKLSFAFSKGEIAPTQGAVSKVNEESLRAVGFEFSSTQGPPRYSFSSMGGWNPSFRASIVRVSMLKLLGSGIVAAFLSISPHSGRYTGFSLSLSAGVNFVAVYFYYRIWQLRAQLFGGDKYNRFTAVVGREQAFQGQIAQEEGEPLNKNKEEQEEHDKHVIYWQEVEVDGCRYADWLCTLVLMTLDLGHLREYLTAVSGGFIPPMPISKEWLASLQAIMILFASVYRFYTNEARPRPDAEVLPDGSLRTPCCTMVVGWGSFFAASGVFGVIVWAFLDGLPDASDVVVSSVQYDLICLRVLVLIWIGYPLVVLASRMAHWNVPGDQYNATWSLIKDISFAFLDVTSKAGLAIFFILKTTYVSGASEAALLLRANVTHA